MITLRKRYQLAIELAHRLGYLVDESRMNHSGPRFSKGHVNIWGIIEGWQVADLYPCKTDRRSECYQNHRPVGGIGYALLREAYNDGVCPPVMRSMEFTIGAHYTTVLRYGDISGLERSDEIKLDGFVKGLPSGGWWEFGEHDEFVRDEVTGLMGECVHATYWYWHNWRAEDGT